jgi:phosphate uptake regulator
VQSTPKTTKQSVARANARTVEHFRVVHYSNNRPGDVVFALSVHAWHLCGLPADESATRRLARFGQAAQELSKDVRLEFASRDVVEKKQRSRAEHRNIIDAVVDEI